MRGGSGTRQRLCCCHHRQGPGTRHELIGDLPPPTEALLKRQPMAASPAAAPHTMAMRSAQANVVAITQPRSSLRPRVSSGEKKSTRPTCAVNAGGVAGQRGGQRAGQRRGAACGQQTTAEAES